MDVHKLTPEQVNESFARFGAGDDSNSASPPAASAEDVLNRVGRAQERMGAAGHQADYYVPSESIARGAFAAVNQKIRTNPAPLQEEGRPAGLNTVIGGQPGASPREARPEDNEQGQVSTRTATHVGHTALGNAPESVPQQPFTPLPLEAIGDVLNEPASPERPFDASWAPPRDSTAVQQEHLGIQERLQGL